MNRQQTADRRQPGRWRTFVALCLLAVLSAVSSAQTVPPLFTEEWKFDVIYRTQGREPIPCLVIEQSATTLHFKRVYRQTGKPTVIILDHIPRSDVARVEMLGPKEREQLITRLSTLKRERGVLAAQLQLWKGGRLDLPAGEAPALKPVPWGKDGKSKGLGYTSTYFSLHSDAREDLVQLTAIHLEQVFTAYVRCLPPRVKEPRPTTILMTRSLAEYNALVKERGYNLLNPAFYDPARNQVVCGSDLERLSQELERVKEHHEKMRADLQMRRADLIRIYNRQVPPELLRPIDEALRKIQQVEDKNKEVFKTSHSRLLQRLFHESFHAYLASSVFADRKLVVPPWLNEGLAQIFETALFEGGELRVGHADPERRRRVQAALKKNEFLSLATLLKASPRQFQVAHVQDRQVSDRHYLASWALAFDLTFERQVLGTPALVKYLEALQRGVDPLEAFRELTGKGLSDFEKDFHRYLNKLQDDGTSPMAMK
ncbi:MAG TPA: DUF1570 domain-containing protein [Gemmataceae bacterium]|nr:DUF1570 domain-containing protein [Gemmataceae bacterium]